MKSTVCSRPSRPVFALVSVALLVASIPARAGSGPTYATPEARALVERMVAAHGGIDKFRQASAIHFDCTFEVHFGGDTWAPFRGVVTANPRTRQVYATLPNPDGTEGRIAYDGKQAWSAGNLQGMAKAPARMTAWRDLYLYALPWMTQDSGVLFDKPESVKMPIGGVDCMAVRMTFEAGAGDTPRDWYVLFIDPVTHRLRAAQYVMTYAALMQNGATASPPSILVWEETANVEGMIVPTKYTVHWAGDGSVVVRNGRIQNWAFDGAFDPAQLTMPADGQIDRSTP